MEDENPTPVTTITKLKCGYKDCQHEWFPRTTQKPKVCPKCKRYNWDKWEVENNEVEEPSQEDKSKDK